MRGGLSDFLLARIAEDKATALDLHASFGSDPWALERRDRARAECDAKRRIVGLAPSPDEWDDYSQGQDVMHARVLELLAGVYSDHPDYREEWS